MLVTELGIVMEVRAEQTLNAPSPMLVTELGMVVDWHPAIRVLEAVATVAVQFSRESFTVAPLSSAREVREEQFSNALLPMLVTVLGRMMAVREEHSSNEDHPMLVTELPRDTEVREAQLLNA